MTANVPWLPADLHDEIGDLVAQNDPAVTSATSALARTFPDFSDKVFYVLWAQVAVTAARAADSHPRVEA